MKTRRHSLLLLGSAVLAACSAPAIVTRNEKDPFEGGIGGTGIVGTLYGFSSLLINGLRVELEGSTSYATPFGGTTSAALLPGQVLTVSADRTTQRLVSRDVAIDYALVGILRHGHGAASVNGVPLIDATDALGHGAAGSRVAVSGVWTPTGVRPSRIDPAPHSLDLIAGTASLDGHGGLVVGGIPVEAPDPTPTEGAYVTAFGRAHDGGFTAERLHSNRFARLGSLRQLSVEGYLEPAPTAPGLRIAGLGHNFARDVGLSTIGARRAIYFGRYTGLFGAQSGYIVPDGFEARTQVLTPGLAEGFSGPVVRL